MRHDNKSNMNGEFNEPLDRPHLNDDNRMKEEMTNLENDMRESEAQAENSSLMSATQKSMASHAYDLKYRRYQQFNSEVKAYKFKQVAQYEGEDAGKIKKILWSPKIRLGYIIHLILKFCFEMVFFYSVYWYQTKQTGVSLVTIRLDLIWTAL